MYSLDKRTLAQHLVWHDMSDKKTEVYATHRPDQLHGERSLVVVSAQNLSPSFFFLSRRDYTVNIG